MLSLPLELRYGAAARREAAAWVVPGDGPRQWLDEIAGWEVPLAGARLYVVPQARDDLRPRGVLIVLPAERRPKISPKAQPYACLAGRLYAPVEARVEPEVADAELASLLGSDDRTYVWHPAVGLVAFEPGDALRVEDLLAAPPRREAAWDRAQPGVAVNRRILSIEPLSPPTIETILEEGRGDIGSQPLESDRLPPSPDEPGGGPLASLGQAMQGFLARAARWMAKGLARGRGQGSGAAAPGMLSRVAAWAERQLARLSEQLLAERFREISRLLHLLETDPDEGLRYALPLAEAGHAPRGLAPPGSRLGRRNVDFTLRGLGGGPADYWRLPGQYHQRLHAKYRALANRELQLGRYRRAAYIFAQLLGDLPAAASALTSGGHWREAAALYRERLHRPWDAARCLEQGGLWSEAISLYSELGAHEKAGDLYARLDQRENAERAWRLAVHAHDLADNHLEAARLLEEKLNAPGEALGRLDAGWPGSHQAAQCLQQSFRLLGRLGRHDETLRRIERLTWRSLPDHAVGPLVDNLAQVATGYPDETVRRHAADATRRQAAELLPQSTPLAAEHYVTAVASLVPDDRLLARDCERFVRRHRERGTVRRPPAERTLTLVRIIELPGGVEWQAATCAGTVFYAAGYLGGRIVVVRGRWDGSIQVAEGWSPGPPVLSPERPLLLAPNPLATDLLIVHPVGGPAMRWRAFPETDSFRRQLWAGTPEWMPQGAIGVARVPGGLTWVVAQQADGLVLYAYSPTGTLAASRVFPVPAGWRPPVVPLPIHARAESVYLAIGEQLVKVHHDYRVERIELPDTIVALTGSQPHSTPRLAAALEHGASAYFDDGPRGHIVRFGDDLGRPSVAFTSGGWLVAAGAEQIDVYRAGERRIVLEHSLAQPRLNAWAVLATDDANHFAVCTSAGRIRAYRIP